MALHTVVFNYLIIAPHVLLVAILVLLIRRQLIKEFPAFFLYVVSELLQFLVLFTLLRLPSVPAQTYATGYSVGLGISTLLRFCVLYEVAAHILRDYSVVAGASKAVFSWAGISLVLVALLLALATLRVSLHQAMSSVYILDRTATIVQCGLLLLLFLFSSYLGFSWRSQTFGIALGLGIFATVELANAAMRAHIPYAYGTYLDYLTMATYHACVLIWIYYLWVPERVPVQTQKLPEQDLEAWNRELQRLIQQ